MVVGAVFQGGAPAHGRLAGEVVHSRGREGRGGLQRADGAPWGSLVVLVQGDAQVLCCGGGSVDLREVKSDGVDGKAVVPVAGVELLGVCFVRAVQWGVDPVVSVLDADQDVRRDDGRCAFGEDLLGVVPVVGEAYGEPQLVFRIGVCHRVRNICSPFDVRLCPGYRVVSLPLVGVLGVCDAFGIGDGSLALGV